MSTQQGLFDASQLPSHFGDENPRFVEFLNLYYKWLHRRDGMTQEEVQDFRNDPSYWVGRDVDKFIASGGSSRYSDSKFSADDAEMEVMTYRAPGFVNENFASSYNLERSFDEFLTADGDYFTDAAELSLESPYLLGGVKESWAGKFGHKLSKSISTDKSFDEILNLRILKSIYSAKGTDACVKLFFSTYFGVEVTLHYPKFEVCIIDDNFLVDSINSIRDDNLYQEYSYIVYVPGEPSLYQEMFDEIYMKNFHPGGFRAFLKKQPQ